MKSHTHKSKSIRAAFTLVEMLIAMALTLILVYAIAEFYAYIGNAVRDGRATIEMGGQLRAAAQQLNDDLECLTLRPTPWINPATSPGYFSVYEGPGYDADPEAAGITAGARSLVNDSNNDNIKDLIQNNNATNLFGDGDDVLAFTIRAKGTPFQGRYNGSVTTSLYAEVIWFTSFVDTNGDNTWNVGEYRFLCRRLLLIRPDLGGIGRYEELEDTFDFWETNDISVHMAPVTDPMSSGDTDYVPVANSLAELSLRQNRFGCGIAANAPRGNGAAAVYNGQPWPLDINPNNSQSMTMYTMQNAGFGEERMLTNVLAFDVRVWDPEARVYSGTGAINNVPLVAGDPGYSSVAANEGTDPMTQNPPRLIANMPTNSIGVGAYVDLFYNSGINREGGQRAWTHFSRAANFFGYGMWDTWPTTYETNGPGNGQAMNGLDDDGINGVDDPGERQTQPPYMSPLRGIQVRIRVYEPQTRQARQVTVGADFIGD
ncbi:prepilin-type N-terminal cleavage/methylation domain-containing protein [Anatilimnocola floriformis]|uniref:prepilin-type N-terminal cleavage/methylation domain-containing protein n=1 Tax=Anatilimnocola floriformis TaxID=2948575 RepID=UPI0020C21A81|nr:prepilin-type N-terminal cleavage/methylation domain-containing protein [Anatilimnocola floriformis]